ncbi:30S ribosomal protein S6e, partial [Candidatus Bathyarchaeota archaeon]
MAKFTLNVSDPKAKTTRPVALEGVRAQPLVGKGIGESVDGRLLNIGTVMLKITGGTDKDGIPMRWDIQGTAKKKALLTKGVGFRSKVDGERRRKLVRGRVVGDDTMQVN